MRLFFWLAVILSISGFAACSGDDSPDEKGGSGRLRVVATTVQITALAKEVGGEDIELHGIIPAGADAHEFEPTASDLRAIEDADVILRHGIGLDDWIEDTLGAGDVEPVVVTEGIAVHEGEAEAEDEGNDHAEDPHVWQDPANDKTMVDNIAAALGDADPDNASAYDANAQAYNDVLDETRDEVQAIIDEIPAENRKLVTMTPSATSPMRSDWRSWVRSYPAFPPAPSRQRRTQRRCWIRLSART